jgi:hypothetical protein
MGPWLAGKKRAFSAFSLDLFPSLAEKNPRRRVMARIDA